MINNSWMQFPVGYTIAPDGVFVPNDWAVIIFNSVTWVRSIHMVLAAYVTCIRGTDRLARPSPRAQPVRDQHSA